MPHDEKYLGDLMTDTDRQSLVRLAQHGIPWNIAVALPPDTRVSWLDDIERMSVQPQQHAGRKPV